MNWHLQLVKSGAFLVHAFKKVEWSLLAFKHPHVKAGTLQHSHLEFYCGSVRINHVVLCVFICFYFIFVCACDCFIGVYKGSLKLVYLGIKLTIYVTSCCCTKSYFSNAECNIF